MPSHCEWLESNPYICASIFVLLVRQHNCIHIHLTSLCIKYPPCSCSKDTLKCTTGFHEGNVCHRYETFIWDGVCCHIAKSSKSHYVVYNMSVWSHYNSRVLPCRGKEIIIISIISFIIDMIRELPVWHSKLAHLNSILYSPNPPPYSPRSH